MRLQKGEQQADIAMIIDVSPQSYSAYENGREPNYETLIILAKHYGVSIDYLLGISDNPNPDKALEILIPIPPFSDVFVTSEEIEQLCQDYFNGLGSYATLPDDERQQFSEMLKQFNTILKFCKVVGKVDNLMGQQIALVELHEAASELLKLLAALINRNFDKYCEMSGGKPKIEISWSSKPPKKKKEGAPDAENEQLTVEQDDTSKPRPQGATQDIRED